MPKIRGKKIPTDVIRAITGRPDKTEDPKDAKGFADRASRQALGATSSAMRNSVFGDEAERKAKMTTNLLKAVAYGMESSEVNTPVIASVAKGLFLPTVFVKDVLSKYPKFFLERAHVTDWAYL